jgi:hypothetical protein
MEVDKRRGKWRPRMNHRDLEGNIWVKSLMVTLVVRFIKSEVEKRGHNTSYANHQIPFGGSFKKKLKRFSSVYFTP